MQLETYIIFEDADLVVLNKPAGVVVNDAASAPGTTVQTWFHHYLLDKNEPWPENWREQLPHDFTDQYGTPEEIFLERQGIVHRLDKDTSGALILAKHPGSLLSLMRQFKDRKTHKEYLCLVHGAVKNQTDVIKLPIGRSPQQRQKFQVDMSGRPAETRYERKATGKLPTADFVALLEEHEMTRGRTTAQLEKEYDTYGTVSLIQCEPKTGRTHQIRVHMSFLQHPLVGDTHYLGKRGKLDALWCPRQFLHAVLLEVRHPRTHERVSWQAPLAEDLQKVLSLVGIALSY